MTETSSENARLRALESFFKRRFGRMPERAFSSPGRAEIVGNHTDHNLGKVLVSAVSCDILCLVEKRDDGIVEIASERYGTVRFSANDLAPRPRERGKSVALARGVLAYLRDVGYPVGGFSAVSDSTIFRGAGVSSSAAFEVLAAEIENRLWCGGRISPFEKAKAGRFAENEYFGKPCGLLDQSGIALGGLNKIDFADPEAPVAERVPAPEGYRIVLVNTGGSHSELTEHYAAIRNDMTSVAAAFGKRYLREVDEALFRERVPRLRGTLSDRALLRAFHFFEENRRADEAAEALKAGDAARFLKQVQSSGESSLAFLQNCYVPGETAQPLALALKLSEKICDGAYRMMGGGFTGTVLAFCRAGTEERYASEMARTFGRENVFLTELREAGACERKI